MMAEHRTLQKAPLSPQQTDIYLDQAIHKDIPLYNIGGYVDFKGSYQLDLLQQAHHLLVTNADAFSLRLNHSDTEALSLSCDAEPAAVVIHDVSEHEDPEAAAREIIHQLYQTNFDLTQGMFLSGFIQLSPTRCWYYGIAHHLMLDGWGFSNWVKSMCSIYSKLLRSEEPELLMPSFVELLAQENKYIQGTRVVKDKEFWVESFSQLPSLLIEPQERLRLSEAEQKCSKRVEQKLAYPVFEQHKQFATAHGVSVVQLYLGALYVYFSRVHQQQDLVFSLPTHNRRTASAKQTIGSALSVYPSKLSAAVDVTVEELISLIAKRQKSEFRHQRYPLGQLHQDLSLRQQGQSRLFDISFNYQKLDYEVSVEGVTTSTHYLSNGFEQIPLTFTVCDYGSHQDVELQIDYNLSYFNHSKAEAMLHRWSDIVEQMVQQPQLPIADLDLISSYELNQLDQWNTTEKSWPVNHFVEAFEQQVERTPLQTACCYQNQLYTYSELNSLANQYAQVLRATGVEAGDMVAVCLPRRAELLVVLLAVMKLGATYIPMDPSFPVSRLQLMLQHSKPGTVISTESLAIELKQLSDNQVDSSWLSLETLMQDYQIMPTENLDLNLTAQQCAYVLFTSGSTGIPKGVAVSHGALLNFLLSMAKKPGFTASDRLLAVTTVSFDIAGLELYLPLLCGGSLVLATAEAARDGQQLVQQALQHRVTVMQATPISWQLMLEAGWPEQLQLKVLCGGEALPSSLAQQLLERSSEVWNMYGPTETTIWSTISQVTNHNQITIGHPIANTQVYLLDDQLRQVPYGEKGRLFIAGSGLADGYLNDSAQTAAKFFDWQTREGLTTRIYDTGDLASYSDAGHLIHHGRSDNQVKFRGYRIELGDIEAALVRFEQIEDSCVTIQSHDDNSEKSDFIAAYYTTASSVYVSDLKQFLSRLLPQYMMPSVFVPLEHFPMTPNGKKDRNALPKAVMPVVELGEIQLPNSKVEQEILSVWQELLSVQQLSVEQNLFELGASSLDVMRASKMIEQRLGRKLDTVNLFEHTSIRALARYLTNENEVIEEDRSVEVYAGKRRIMQGRKRRNNEEFIC
ncbi:non-ribosomal peptide synthetase [Pseudoalteromonas luteoviolacea]|uniref:Carrier domain-containing protein n=1 Tax=Pseudoalteromonas luteoviolacea S4054 TaxID=1129367 RepID=A0A0F6AC24_9GAMM|nr:non-ribosomal peptide synthetase [Pseudoalteromonas luteoviolacea]AOT10636.1 hypothetical protein S4054249_22510 [Pseudoalteromonas luteoviolacea]AOT15296.1 hypothetical protein S40542_21085 [Pseudoalteromonas luteoviolacea]AOT20455.1 hypothetical protein S4054_22425 [Pseudoalteromonas luteoviolacea]KKE83735.1 hypothetical protein N479_12980 [Pseudoalteromonas luteoviolacea S4054]KZN71939.1 hypothetical protein N481_17345 [Pseudoalteromonas luteoviolacea S4047-1]